MDIYVSRMRNKTTPIAENYSHLVSLEKSDYKLNGINIETSTLNSELIGIEREVGMEFLAMTRLGSWLRRRSVVQQTAGF